MPRYGPKAHDKVAEVLQEFKQGRLRSGTAGQKVTSRRQAIAIGLSEARREGDPVPAEPARRPSASKASAKKASAKKASAKKALGKRPPAKRPSAQQARSARSPSRKGGASR